MAGIVEFLLVLLHQRHSLLNRGDGMRKSKELAP